MKNCITVAACQFDIQIFDKEYNLRKMEEFSAAAAEKGVDLIVFPEASLAGYSFSEEEEARSTAEPLSGPSSAYMSDVSKRNKITIVFGMAELVGAAIYNSVVCCQPDGSIQAYHKTHLPVLGLDRFVSPGEDLSVVDTDFGPMGMICCFDMRFPETVRTEMLKGARIVVHPTNLPPAGTAYPEYLNRSRACENRVFIVSANRIGDERGFHFIGRSQILSSGGEILGEMNEEEGMILANLDLSLAEQKDIIVRPGIHEMHLVTGRRPDLYDTIVQ